VCTLACLCMPTSPNAARNARCTVLADACRRTSLLMGGQSRVTEEEYELPAEETGCVRIRYSAPGSGA
jgi:hypothetical protein